MGLDQLGDSTQMQQHLANFAQNIQQSKGDSTKSLQTGGTESLEVNIHLKTPMSPEGAQTTEKVAQLIQEGPLMRAEGQGIDSNMEEKLQDREVNIIPSDNATVENMSETDSKSNEAINEEQTEEQKNTEFINKEIQIEGQQGRNLTKPERTKITALGANAIMYHVFGNTASAYSQIVQNQIRAFQKEREEQKEEFEKAKTEHIIKTVEKKEEVAQEAIQQDDIKSQIIKTQGGSPADHIP